MKKKLRYFAGLALLVCLVVIVNVYLDATKNIEMSRAQRDPQAVQTGKTASWAVAVYDQVEGRGHLIGVVTAADAVKVIGQTKSGWWKITYMDADGNVISGYVGLIEHLESSDEK